jgi:hypothetical protein
VTRIGKKRFYKNLWQNVRIGEDQIKLKKILEIEEGKQVILEETHEVAVYESHRLFFFVASRFLKY